MRAAGSDRFLGEWIVRESVFAPDGAALGFVHQLRRVFEAKGSDDLIIQQLCEPDAGLATHPMGRFSGEFVFHLQRSGRFRYYQGPDVQGFARFFGEHFLVGQGVWPRFGWNFRSWSIALSPSQQLTGGAFFRGLEPLAFIVGAGQQNDAMEALPRFAATWSAHAAAGHSIRAEASLDAESSRPYQRQSLGQGQWTEQAASEEKQIYQLEAQGTAFILHRQQQECGMARMYGPALSWESFDQQGSTTVGLEVSDPFFQQQFALRQRFHHGQLVQLEALQLKPS